MLKQTINLSSVCHQISYKRGEDGLGWNSKYVWKQKIELLLLAYIEMWLVSAMGRLDNWM